MRCDMSRQKWPLWNVQRTLQLNHDKELSKNVDTEEEAGWAMLGSMIGTGIGGLIIDNFMKVDNYFKCSVGTITYERETKIVSLSFMNHIFTLY